MRTPWVAARSTCYRHAACASRGRTRANRTSFPASPPPRLPAPSQPTSLAASSSPPTHPLTRLWTPNPYPLSPPASTCRLPTADCLLSGVAELAPSVYALWTLFKPQIGRRTIARRVSAATASALSKATSLQTATAASTPDCTRVSSSVGLLTARVSHRYKTAIRTLEPGGTQSVTSHRWCA